VPSIIRSDPKAREKPCLRCGYSLRRILDAKHCPECGLSVWLSLNQNDSLDWSHPDWLRMMSLAALVLAIAQVPGLAAWALLFARGPDAWPALLAGAFFIIQGVGLALLSWPEHRHPDRFKAHRVALRIFAAISLLSGALVLTQGLRLLGRSWSYFILGYFELTGLELLALSGSIAAYAYLRPLARRIPSSIVVRICGYLLFLPLLALLALLPLLVGSFLFIFFHYAVRYLPWVYLPVSAVLLLWFSLTFLKASRAAAAHWAAETAPGASP
jgi:hypothetical protein